METFPVTPDFPVDEVPRFNTLVSQFDNGVEQRRGKWSSALREFSLRFSNRSQAEFTSVRDFLIARGGALTAFTFTNPNDSTQYVVRFKEDSLRFSQKSYQVFDFECTLAEVR